MNSTEFPPQETFYSKLKQEGISDEDYLNAKKNLTMIVKLLQIIQLCI